MTMERQDILEDFYAGNYKVLRDTVLLANGNPKDLTGAEVTFALFTDKNQVLIVKSSENINEVEIVDATAGVVDIFLQPEDTLHLSGLYRYHVNAVDANGYEETVTSGKIHIYASFARRYRHSKSPAYLTGLAA